MQISQNNRTFRSSSEPTLPNHHSIEMPEILPATARAPRAASSLPRPGHARVVQPAPARSNVVDFPLPSFGTAPASALPPRSLLHSPSEWVAGAGMSDRPPFDRVSWQYIKGSFAMLVLTLCILAAVVVTLVLKCKNPPGSCGKR